jgi:hypothetical protein
MSKSKSLKSLIKTSKNKNNTKISLNRPKPLSTVNEVSSDSSTIDSDSNLEVIKLNDLIYPCKDEVLYTKVILHPHQMNNDIYINLKKNLVDKVQGKCTKYGYITKVYKIIEYVDGIIEPESFTGVAIYNVKYLANVCVALKDTIIVAKITSYIPNASFAVADFGPTPLAQDPSIISKSVNASPIIKIIFTKNEKDLNTEIFKLGNDRSIIHKESNKKLALGDYIKIQLKSIKLYQYDTIIKCMGHLNDIVTEDEMNKFAYKDENNKLEVSNSNATNVEFNEDDVTMETNIESSKTNYIDI